MLFLHVQMPFHGWSGVGKELCLGLELRVRFRGRLKVMVMVRYFRQGKHT